MTNKKPIYIEYTGRFKKDIKRLRKKYPRIQEDVQTLTTQLQNHGTPGDQISGVNHTVYKVRLRNSDTQKGKSSGYRVIYYIKTAELIVLVTMFIKSELVDISTDQIRAIIEEFNKGESSE